jgi:L-seryl-tRNA(Ser) seleniumtransferase
LRAKIKRVTDSSFLAAALRALPRVDDVARFLSAEFALPQSTLARAARGAIASVRDQIGAGKFEMKSGAAIGNTAAQSTLDAVLKVARRDLKANERSFPAPVLNATGIIIHTGLGRSRLSQAATAAVMRAASESCALEVDLESGGRGRRDACVAELLREITGCEDATVCNNGAGAMILLLSALAAGREVICSRGELVEIGGGFRMPDVMLQSGAILREVGCTNKTRLADYEAALGERSAVLLKVHPSNFRIEGFVEETSLPDLVALGRKNNVATIEDLGSGLLIDLAPYGLGDEPTVQSRVASGADAIVFSGDKLLGGPQCGIVCGREETVARVRRHPLMRALRADKMTLAALDATLRAYRDSSDNWARARREIPTLTAITTPLELVRARALRLRRRLQKARVPASVTLSPSSAQAGAGALPTRALPSWSVGVRPHHQSTEEFARRLRMSAGEVSVWGRVHNGALYFDCRTLFENEIALCAAHIMRVLSVD